jgi:hypothetical protein
MSILWMRSQALTEGAPVVAQTAATVAAAGNAETKTRSTGEPDSYVVPRQPAERRMVVPGTQLANYVVAHSEFSSPVTRRNLLSALMASESGTAGASAGSEEPTEDVYDDAKSTQ